MTALTVLGDRVLRSATMRRSLTRATGRRGLVLLIHRVSQDGPAPHEVVPTVPTALLRRQLEALRDIADLVPLSAIDDPSDRGRPRIALTFDDDHAGHAAHALPLLQEMGLTATFFLSGRWEHGLGPYWWEVLEEMIRRDGLDAVAGHLGQPGATDPASLAARIEDTPIADELALDGASVAGPRMEGGDAQRLVDAGMAIGFHTLEHRVMTTLEPEAVARAVTLGRDGLAATLATSLDLFAYPHGRATCREAEAVAAAGFRAAWTTSPRPVVPATDPYLRGRWEPGLAAPDEVVRGALLRLARRPLGAERP